MLFRIKNVKDAYNKFLKSDELQNAFTIVAYTQCANTIRRLNHIEQLPEDVNFAMKIYFFGETAVLSELVASRTDFDPEKLAYLLVDSMLQSIRALVSGGTDNHLMLLDLKDLDISGKELENRLDSVGITANKNMVPGDPRKPSETSGVRLGTPAVTTRGFKEEEMRLIGRLICDAVEDFSGKRKEIQESVDDLCSRFPIYESKFKS